MAHKAIDLINSKKVLRLQETHIKHKFDHFELLQFDEETDIFYMTTYSEVELSQTFFI